MSDALTGPLAEIAAECRRHLETPRDAATKAAAKAEASRCMVPHVARKLLVRAGTLIVAELERLDRAEAKNAEA